MAKTSPIFVMMLINFTGFILSFECGDQWLVMADCPAFFPGYNTSFVNMTVATIYNCVYKAKKEPTAKSLVFHKDSQTGQNKCFLYETIAFSCGDSEEGDFGFNRYLFKPYNCQNGGNLTGDKLKCDCPIGYFGPSCTELPTDCQDLRIRGGISTRGQYSINLIPSQPPITLTCFYGRTVVMYQDINNDANFTFNRSWAEYRDGFYGNDNFWVGLKIMNILTTEKSQNTLDMSVKMFNPDQNTDNYLGTFFEGFIIDKENTQFVMTYRSHSFISDYVGEVFRTLNNSRFSTYDSDNDNMAINCAVKYGGGWWYNQAGIFSRGSRADIHYECAPANPTGYFWNQCEHCSSEVKDISTGSVDNGIVQKVELVLMP